MSIGMESSLKFFEYEKNYYEYNGMRRGKGVPFPPSHLEAVFLTSQTV